MFRWAAARKGQEKTLKKEIVTITHPETGSGRKSGQPRPSGAWHAFSYVRLAAFSHHLTRKHDYTGYANIYFHRSRQNPDHSVQNFTTDFGHGTSTVTFCPPWHSLDLKSACVRDKPDEAGDSLKFENHERSSVTLCQSVTGGVPKFLSYLSGSLPL
jgi:hypothetical protein